ncbi:MAG: hypothetical protein JOZ47_22055, partial [Kutzneria sp.]|nr:hypothetical protein [Kutzneria sp.]
MTMFDAVAPRGAHQQLGRQRRTSEARDDRPTAGDPPGPESLVDVVSAGCAEHLVVHGRWQRLSELVWNDPILRLHCALCPPHDLTGQWGSVETPFPPHPRCPGTGLPVALRTLLSRSGAGEPTLLERVVANRDERRIDPLDFAVEYLMVPLVRVFRTLFDQHRLGLLGLNERTIVFELTPEVRATGRLVITGVGGLREVDELSPIEVDRAMRSLHAALVELASAFQRTSFGCRRYRERTVRAAVERTVAQELRFLRPETAAVLRGDHSFDRHVHSVSTEQDALLTQVLRRVENRAATRRKEPALPVPTVVVDLDMCGLVPRARTLRAARVLSGPRLG